MGDNTTIVISKDTRKLISHLKYEMCLDTYDQTIRSLIELHKGSDKYDYLKRFLGIK